MYFYDKVNQNRHSLNKTEEKLYEYFIEKQDIIKYLTIQIVSNDNFIAQNTVVRFCKKLGFSGFSEFKEALFLSSIDAEDYMEQTDLDIQIIKTKQLLNVEILNKIIDLIHNSEKIIILGVGSSRNSASELSDRLQMIGLNSKTFIEPHFMKYNCSILSQNDLVISFSASGETETILDATNIAILNKAKAVSITSFSNNQLSRITNFQLYAFTNILKINGLDVSDRLTFHYLSNLIFIEYVEKYLKK